jgi:tRNA1(Val) A37 N6-methylase TrmN6
LFVLSNVTITEDSLLEGKIILKQPSQGYRVAIDPVFLAAAIEVHDEDTVLDIGAGVGAASLCLAHRNPTIKVTGLEVMRDYVRMASENANLNNMRHQVEFLLGDLLSPPPRLAAGTFAHVMTNPPYIENNHGRQSPSMDKTTSHMEGNADLEQWARFCLLMVKPKGTVTFIHRADRLDAVLSYFYGKLGDIRIFPLWPGVDRACKRVLIQGKKNSHGGLSLLPGLVLHNPDGSYTHKANDILRKGHALTWES